MAFEVGGMRITKDELSDLTDDELINSIRRSDPRAVNVLIQRYERRLFSFIYRMVGRLPDAEDLAQDVFVRAFKSLSNYQSQGTFGAWIYTIARNVLKTHFTKVSRGNRCIVSNDLLESVPDTKRVVGCDEDDEIYSMLAFLPDDYRRIVLLKYVSNMSCTEIAQIEELSEAAVKQRLHRARIMIRDNKENK